MVKLEQTNCGLYYITIENNNIVTSLDEKISECMGISTEEYKRICKNKYNAIEVYENDIYFINKKDGDKTIKWIESMLLARKYINLKER